nr:RNA ligase family protein [Paraburkholderia sp. BCC1886]
MQKGTYQIGDEALYFEIDAAIPLDSPIFADFDKQYLRVKKDEGNAKEYAVIKTIRLRGALSQGLLISRATYAGTGAAGNSVGTNVTNALDVLKYVSPEEARLYTNTSLQLDDKQSKKLVWRLRAWLVNGIVSDGLQPFPHGHVKSEEERVQNQFEEYTAMAKAGETAELSIKLDGESSTFYTELDSAKIGVAQRNYSLRTDDVLYTRWQSLRVYLADWVRCIARRRSGADCDTPRWKKGFLAQSVPLVAYFTRENLAYKIALFNDTNDLPFAKGKKLAIQGEMVGPDFNRNADGAKTNCFYMYRTFVNGNMRLLPEQARQVADALGVKYIPVMDANFALPPTIKEVMALADGPGHFDQTRLREGLVMKNNVTGKSFKIISNKWLEKKEKKEA